MKYKVTYFNLFGSQVLTVTAKNPKSAFRKAFGSPISGRVSVARKGFKTLLISDNVIKAEILPVKG